MASEPRGAVPPRRAQSSSESKRRSEVLHYRSRSHFSIPDVTVTSCNEQGDETTHFEVQLSEAQRRALIPNQDMLKTVARCERQAAANQLEDSEVSDKLAAAIKVLSRKRRPRDLVFLKPGTAYGVVSFETADASTMPVESLSPSNGSIKSNESKKSRGMTARMRKTSLPNLFGRREREAAFATALQEMPPPATPPLTAPLRMMSGVHTKEASNSLNNKQDHDCAHAQSSPNETVLGTSPQTPALSQTASTPAGTPKELFRDAPQSPTSPHRSTLPVQSLFSLRSQKQKKSKASIETHSRKLKNRAEKGESSPEVQGANGELFRGHNAQRRNNLSGVSRGRFSTYPGEDPARTVALSSVDQQADELHPAASIPRKLCDKAETGSAPCEGGQRDNRLHHSLVEHEHRAKDRSDRYETQFEERCSSHAPTLQIDGLEQSSFEGDMWGESTYSLSNFPCTSRGSSDVNSSLQESSDLDDFAQDCAWPGAEGKWMDIISPSAYKGLTSLADRSHDDLTDQEHPFRNALSSMASSAGGSDSGCTSKRSSAANAFLPTATVLQVAKDRGSPNEQRGPFDEPAVTAVLPHHRRRNLQGGEEKARYRIATIVLDSGSDWTDQVGLGIAAETFGAASGQGNHTDGGIQGSDDETCTAQDALPRHGFTDRVSTKPTSPSLALLDSLYSDISDVQEAFQQRRRVGGAAWHLRKDLQEHEQKRPEDPRQHVQTPTRRKGSHTNGSVSSTGSSNNSLSLSTSSIGPVTPPLLPMAGARSSKEGNFVRQHPSLMGLAQAPSLTAANGAAAPRARSATEPPLPPVKSARRRGTGHAEGFRFPSSPAASGRTRRGS